jgi:hypothetical protein
LGAPSSKSALEFTDLRDEFNQYALRYVTADGTIVIERGSLVDSEDGKDKVMVYEGEYRYEGKDGKTYVTKYKSNAEGGFQVEGDHLPKPVEA